MKERTEPQWLSLELILSAHDRLVAKFGGESGIRDTGLLESALAAPQNIFHYEASDDIFGLAAAYAHGLTRNHPFFDGNKRTAFAACLMFLALNDIHFSASEQESLTMTLALTNKEMTREEFAGWLKLNCRKK